MHRPLFDVDGEDWRAFKNGTAERLERSEIIGELFEPGFEE